MQTKFRTPILLIEDNPADADLVRIYLEEVGFKYDLLHSDTLEKGLELVETKEVEIVLLDLSVSDCNGFKTLTKFLEKAAHVPVIVLTGVNNEIVGNQAIKAGAQDFLVKGQFDGKLLGRAVRYALQRFKSQSKLEELARNLAINENRMQEAQELAHFGNWDLDIVTNEMRWSEEMCRIFGYQPGSVTPNFSDYLRLAHPEDRPAVESFFEQATKDSALHRLEHRIVLHGKTAKFLSVQARINFDEYTDRVLLMGVVQDITERKLAEQLLLEKQFSSQAIKIREDIISEMGFHVRTPLNSIVNLLFLLENSGTSLAQKEYLRDLKISFDDLILMINNLLNLSILTAEKVPLHEEEFFVEEFLTSLSKMLAVKAETAQTNLKIQVKPSSRQEKAVADFGKITQLLTTLADVIFRTNSPKETVQLDIRLDKEDHGFQLVFDFEDSKGNPEDWALAETLNFDALLNLKSYTALDIRRKAAISIAEKIAVALGGKIEVSGNGDAGTHLQLLFPLKTNQQKAFSIGDKPAAPLRILMVEDHFLNQMSTKKVLQSWSEFVTVEIAENGKVALEMLQNSHFDLILMDIQMPIMNGIEATIEIRKTRDIPIIALTANSSKNEADQCREIGMNDYLTKPFKPQELYSKILASLAVAPV